MATKFSILSKQEKSDRILNEIQSYVEKLERKYKATVFYNVDDIILK